MDRGNFNISIYIKSEKKKALLNLHNKKRNSKICQIVHVTDSEQASADYLNSKSLFKVSKKGKQTIII